MHKAFTVVGTSLGLLLSNPVASLAQSPDAIIELSGGSVAAGIGYSWGHGTLIFHGNRYPVVVSGLSLATVGVVGYSASGEVYGLKSPGTSTASTPLPQPRARSAAARARRR